MDWYVLLLTVDTILDTLPEEVRKITFQPSLAVHPLPEGVIDELRNKYSKHRAAKECARRRQLWKD